MTRCMHLYMVGFQKKETGGWVVALDTDSPPNRFAARTFSGSHLSRGIVAPGVSVPHPTPRQNDPLGQICHPANVMSLMDTLTFVKLSVQFSFHTASLGGSRLPEAVYPANAQVPSPSRPEAAVMLGSELPKIQLAGDSPFPSQLLSK